MAICGPRFPPKPGFTYMARRDPAARCRHHAQDRRGIRGQGAAPGHAQLTLPRCMRAARRAPGPAMFLLRYLHPKAAAPRPVNNE